MKCPNIYCEKCKKWHKENKHSVEDYRNLNAHANKQYYECEDEILEHARSMGYIPEIVQRWTNDIEGEVVTTIEVNFCLPDGSSPFSRTYDKWENKPYEFVEESH